MPLPPYRVRLMKKINPGSIRKINKSRSPIAHLVSGSSARLTGASRVCRGGGSVTYMLPNTRLTGECERSHFSIHVVATVTSCRTTFSSSYQHVGTSASKMPNSLTSWTCRIPRAPRQGEANSICDSWATAKPSKLAFVCLPGTQHLQ